MSTVSLSNVVEATYVQATAVESYIVVQDDGIFGPWVTDEAVEPSDEWILAMDGETYGIPTPAQRAHRAVYGKAALPDGRWQFQLRCWNEIPAQRQVELRVPRPLLPETYTDADVIAVARINGWLMPE